MKTKITITALIICIGAIINLNAGPAYNLSGDWGAVITVGMPQSQRDTIKDIVRISQQGNEFVGIKTIGGKWIGKNEELIKGKLSDGKIEDACIRYCHDPITFAMSWSDGKATISEDGNEIVLHSFVPSANTITTITLTKKQ